MAGFLFGKKALDKAAKNGEKPPVKQEAQSLDYLKGQIEADMKKKEQKKASPKAVERLSGKPTPKY